MDSAQDHNQQPHPSLAIRDIMSRFGVLIRAERRVLGLIFSYALAIGLFSLIVPLTVQELVNTFAFAIQPITIVTLSVIILASLLFVGAFKAFQVYAEEILQRRLFARVALGMTQHFPDVRIALPSSTRPAPSCRASSTAPRSSRSSCALPTVRRHALSTARGSRARRLLRSPVSLAAKRSTVPSRR